MAMYTPTRRQLRAEFRLHTIRLGLTEGVRLVLGHTNKIPKTAQRCSVNDLLL